MKLLSEEETVWNNCYDESEKTYIPVDSSNKSRKQTDYQNDKFEKISYFDKLQESEEDVWRFEVKQFLRLL